MLALTHPDVQYLVLENQLPDCMLRQTIDLLCTFLDIEQLCWLLLGAVVIGNHSSVEKIFKVGCLPTTNSVQIVPRSKVDSPIRNRQATDFK